MPAFRVHFKATIRGYMEVDARSKEDAKDLADEIITEDLRDIGPGTSLDDVDVIGLKILKTREVGHDDEDESEFN